MTWSRAANARAAEQYGEGEVGVLNEEHTAEKDAPQPGTLEYAQMVAERYGDLRDRTTPPTDTRNADGAGS